MNNEYRFMEADQTDSFKRGDVVMATDFGLGEWVKVVFITQWNEERFICEVDDRIESFNLCESVEDYIAEHEGEGV